MKKLLIRVNRNQGGFILLLTLIIVALGMVVIPATFMFINTGSIVQQRQRARTADGYAADAGTENGIWWVTKADHSSDSLPASEGEFKKMDLLTVGANNVQTYIIYLGEVNGTDTYNVRSYGGPNVLSNANPDDEQPVPYTLVESRVAFTAAAGSLFGNAIGTLNGDITLGSNAIITCTPAPPPYNGNLTANGNISLGANADVYGNAKALGTITEGANADIEGTSSQNSSNTTFLPIDTAPYLTEVQFAPPGTSLLGSSYSNGGTINGNTTLTGNLNLGANKILTVNGNLYMLNGSISLGNNARMTVNGRLYVNAGSVSTNNNAQLTFGGTVYVSGSLTTGSNSSLIIGGTVWMGGAISLSNNNGLSGDYTIVAHDNITFNANSVATSGMPLIISTNGGFNFASNVNVWGFLYAPTANATLNNNASVTGAIVARSVSVASNCHVTYVSVQRPGLPGAGTFQTANVVSWQITQH